jgi:hypothetical protein
MRAYPSRKDQEASRQAMRRKVIALLMAWKPSHFGNWCAERASFKCDMQRIYDWVNTYGHAKPKWLNQYTYSELVKLVSQVKKITNTQSNGTKRTPTQPQSGDQGSIPLSPQGRATGAHLHDGGTGSQLPLGLEPHLEDSPRS